ncbi:hypothetical protein HDU91_004381, partial [Kappamyces sp. JEL0680]
LLMDSDYAGNYQDGQPHATDALGETRPHDGHLATPGSKLLRPGFFRRNPLVAETKPSVAGKDMVLQFSEAGHADVTEHIAESSKTKKRGQLLRGVIKKSQMEKELALTGDGPKFDLKVEGAQQRLQLLQQLGGSGREKRLPTVAPQLLSSILKKTRRHLARNDETKLLESQNEMEENLKTIDEKITENAKLLRTRSGVDMAAARPAILRTKTFHDLESHKTKVDIEDIMQQNLAETGEEGETTLSSISLVQPHKIEDPLVLAQKKILEVLARKLQLGLDVINEKIKSQKAYQTKKYFQAESLKTTQALIVRSMRDNTTSLPGLQQKKRLALQYL